MNTLTKSATLDTLGLPAGDHWVKFHVEGDSISFVVAVSGPGLGAQTGQSTSRAARAFVEKWSGRGRLLPTSEMADDPRLAALTAKHVR
jgi:hypothetical protein